MDLDCNINSLGFNFYSPDEIRKLAVKEITALNSIEIYMGDRAVDGLYDSSLGSWSDREPCKTCHLSYYDCNGHYGRIEFPKPVYNPLLFEYLVKLVKGVCFFCHKLYRGQGLLENIIALGLEDKDVIKKFNTLDEMKSMTKLEKEKCAVKIMSQQLRRLCTNCNRKPLVFSKSRKCELLVHISSKTSKDVDEPETKKRKLDDSCKIYESNFTEDELYGNFTETQKPVFPEIIREHFRILWCNDNESLKLIFPILKKSPMEYPTDIFFMENMLINPPMNRLPAQVGNLKTESPETTNLCHVVRGASNLGDIIRKADSYNPHQYYQVIREGILELQKRVNVCFDSNVHKELSGVQPGLRQKIDKKEGLFRQNIMGKRVNFACRSVISPDPNIGLDEIGVPVIFLKKLTFPEHLNELNKEFLNQCILNGPDVYPGAVSYQIRGEKPTFIGKNREATVSLVNSLMQDQKKVTIHRHALSGDVLIMNRQPTLHKPSMQAHTIRAILDSRAKTLRMHYSNCKAYNADFDGDEMNGHFLQSLHAKSEAKNIVNACFQHSTPKDGSPLAGLIQDHVIAGTRLSMRDCFLERREYVDLVFHGLGDNNLQSLKLLKPAILKPKKLWSGKQVVSTILINSVPENQNLPVICRYEEKKNTLWKTSPSDHALKFSDVDLIIIDGYMCTGILDKSHLGPSQKGMCNDLRELYGSVNQLKILTCFCRMLNRYLIYTGFSTGVKDGMLNDTGNTIRKTIMNKIKAVGLSSIAKTFNLDVKSMNMGQLSDLMEKAQFDKSDQFRNKNKEIDIFFKSLSIPMVGKAGKAKEHMKLPFPHNNLSLMANTGAKGGDSNITKIAIGLGAIEIEGKRCPLTIAGRTLPSFKRYDIDPASRGFCVNRFSSGLTPQEIFFESMAGRDGLVDTAVKTSSSGYLQRCLIKHLEDVVVASDMTVRDNMMNIIQFRYGYDGLDVVNSVILSKEELMEVFGRNIDLMKRKYLSGKEKVGHKMSDSMKRRVEEMVLRLKKDHCHISEDEKQILFEIFERKCRLVACCNGEAVGLLAAQSIGEPSTQMTLNTFHNAGQSEMNVTLGIPRLREILMIGSEKINTPSMEVPIINSSYAKETVSTVLQRFNKLLLKDVFELPFKMTINRYTDLTFTFKKHSSYSHLTSLKRKELIPLIEKTFFKSLAKLIKKYSEQKSIEISEFKDNENAVAAVHANNDEGEPAEDEEKEKEKETGDDKNDDDLSTISDIDDENQDSDHDAEEEDQEMEQEAIVESDDGDKEGFYNVKDSVVLEMCRQYFHRYEVDNNKKPKWIKLTLKMTKCNIDVKSLILNLFETTVISSIEGVEKALITSKNKFATEGYNHLELFKYDKIFNLNKFSSNNIQKMAKLYGVEAAVRCLESEIKTVFGCYSIDVSSRHLRLIADFLTFTGNVEAFNRHSMKNHSSQIQRASYETALTVLNEMLVHGNIDSVKSPSANIMLGQPVSKIGTNSIEMFYDINS